MSNSGNTAPTAHSAKGGDDLWETVKTVGLALLLALVIKTLLFQPFTIPSASEEPNLYEGDYIIVSKWPYGYSRHSILFSPPIFKGRIFSHAPRRGDVMVFKLPRSGHIDYIKRLVGLPGDRIQVRADRLYINDVALPVSHDKTVEVTDRLFPEQAEWRWETNPEGRRYLTQIHGAGDGSGDNTGVYVVPPHCYFMMGDNRQNSLDSRFDPQIEPGDPKLGGCEWDSRSDDKIAGAEGMAPQEAGVGFVPEENLVGRAEIVLLSWNKGASIFKPWTWLDLRMDRFFHRIA